jgi:RNA polymerase sigma-70 factor (ECF subfamily)
MDIEQLFELYHDEIYCYLWRLSHDDALAQDLTQETFLKAMHGLGRLVADSNYRAWLYRIATNTQRDYWRYQGRRPISDLDLELIAAGSSLEHDVEQRDLLRLVAAAVEGLPAKQRAALILSRYQGLGYAEIALALDTSEEAARANVYQAMKKLREQFAEVM